jgi:hypothetical protein
MASPVDAGGVDVAKIVYGLNQSLDGYVDHQVLPVTSPKLFRHFIELAQGCARG